MGAMTLHHPGLAASQGQAAWVRLRLVTHILSKSGLLHACGHVWQLHGLPENIIDISVPLHQL